MWTKRPHVSVDQSAEIIMWTKVLHYQCRTAMCSPAVPPLRLIVSKTTMVHVTASMLHQYVAIRGRQRSCSRLEQFVDMKNVLLQWSIPLNNNTERVPRRTRCVRCCACKLFHLTHNKVLQLRTISFFLVISLHVYQEIICVCVFVL